MGASVFGFHNHSVIDCVSIPPCTWSLGRSHGTGAGNADMSGGVHAGAGESADVPGGARLRRPNPRLASQRGNARFTAEMRLLQMLQTTLGAPHCRTVVVRLLSRRTVLPLPELDCYSTSSCTYRVSRKTACCRCEVQIGATGAASRDVTGIPFRIRTACRTQ